VEEAELVVGHEVRHARHHRRFVALIATLGLAVAGCSDSTTVTPPSSAEAPAITTGTTATTDAATTSTTPSTTALPTTTTLAQGPTGDAFYQPPSPLPPAPAGALIWVAPLGDAPAGTNGFKILYHSRSIADADIAVSGVVFVPKSASRNAPILSYAHGTTGLGDQCAPSKNGATEARLLAAGALSRGFVVVATDYEGLGTPGVHPYLVGLSEGRSVLDAARAAINLGMATSAESPVIVWGHSQGGGSALFAAELAPTYAPDLHVKGAIAGAPAVELAFIGNNFASSPASAVSGFAFMAIAGFKAAYPTLDLSAFLTPKGIAETEKAGVQCNETVTDLTGKNIAEYMTTSPVTLEPYATYLNENTPGQVPTPVPIFVYHGDADELVPVTASELYLKRTCKVGGFTVLRTVYKGGTHVSVIALALNDIASWIDDRLAGKPAPTTACPPA
jgi:alpha-beta hydrolase superfamily lysophospholipase